jgi:hypothetical protein
MIDMVRDCPDCGTPRTFSQRHDEPERCPDSADGRCPEWFCAGCGSGLLVGLPPVSTRLIMAANAGPLDRVA